jgi:hypothetical protein
LEGNSNQGLFFQKICLEAVNIFLTALCVKASNVAAAASIDIPHHLDNPIAVTRDLRLVVETAETLTPYSEGCSEEISSE